MPKHTWLFIIIVLGIIVRLSIIQIPGFSFDVNDFFAWSLKLSQTGFGHFYTGDYFSDYPPGYLYILWLLGNAKELFSLSIGNFYILLKLPAIICDLTLGIFIYNRTYALQ